MTPNPYQDPNFLRRQREKREADKKAKAAAELAKANVVQQAPIAPASRQKAIDARIQELLNKHQEDNVPSV